MALHRDCFFESCGSNTILLAKVPGLLNLLLVLGELLF